MRIEPLTPHIGAVIHDVDLVSCSEAEFEAVYQAWYRHRVIFFREQIFTPEQHLQIASRFGELEPVHPFFPSVKSVPQVSIIETIAGNPPLESFWHTDHTWRTRPSKASLLHAQHVPSCGGDTIWCSMIAAFNALTEDEKQRLRTLSAMHSLFAFENIDPRTLTLDWQKAVKATALENPPVAHPMVTRLAETNEEVLFINEQFTRFVIGLEDVESRALLAKLFALARKPEFQVRFKWQANSLAIWDNRSTQHFAVIDYDDVLRKLHRVTVT